MNKIYDTYRPEGFGMAKLDPRISVKGIEERSKCYQSIFGFRNSSIPFG